MAPSGLKKNLNTEHDSATSLLYPAHPLARTLGSQNLGNNVSPRILMACDLSRLYFYRRFSVPAIPKVYTALVHRGFWLVVHESVYLEHRGESREAAFFAFRKIPSTM